MLLVTTKSLFRANCSAIVIFGTGALIFLGEFGTFRSWQCLVEDPIDEICNGARESTSLLSVKITIYMSIKKFLPNESTQNSLAKIHWPSISGVKIVIEKVSTWSSLSFSGGNKDKDEEDCDSARITCVYAYLA